MLKQEYEMAERSAMNGHSAENFKPLLPKKVYSIPRHLNWRIKGARAAVTHNSTDIQPDQNGSAHLAEEAHEDVTTDAKRFQRPSILRGKLKSIVAV